MSAGWRPLDMGFRERGHSSALPGPEMRFRWDLYDRMDGRLIASSDAVAAADIAFPSPTRYAATQRRAFIKGWAAVIEALSASPSAYSEPKEDADDAR